MDNNNQILTVFTYDELIDKIKQNCAKNKISHVDYLTQERYDIYITEFSQIIDNAIKNFDINIGINKNIELFNTATKLKEIITINLNLYDTDTDLNSRIVDMIFKDIFKTYKIVNYEKVTTLDDFKVLLTINYNKLTILINSHETPFFEELHLLKLNKNNVLKCIYNTISLLNKNYVAISNIDLIVYNIKKLIKINLKSLFTTKKIIFDFNRHDKLLSSVFSKFIIKNIITFDFKTEYLLMIDYVIEYLFKDILEEKKNLSENNLLSYNDNTTLINNNLTKPLFNDDMKENDIKENNLAKPLFNDDIEETNLAKLLFNDDIEETNLAKPLFNYNIKENNLIKLLFNDDIEETNLAKPLFDDDINDSNLTKPLFNDNNLTKQLFNNDVVKENNLKHKLQLNDDENKIFENLINYFENVETTISDIDFKIVVKNIPMLINSTKNNSINGIFSLNLFKSDLTKHRHYNKLCDLVNFYGYKLEIHHNMLTVLKT